MLFLLLPLFRETANGFVGGVSLLALCGVAPVLKAVYCALVIVTALLGVAILALQNWECALWVRGKAYLSVGLNLLSTVAFALGLHPYAAVYMIFILIFKSLF